MPSRTVMSLAEYSPLARENSSSAETAAEPAGGMPVNVHHRTPVRVHCGITLPLHPASLRRGVRASGLSSPEGNKRVTTGRGGALESPHPGRMDAVQGPLFVNSRRRLALAAAMLLVALVGAMALATTVSADATV